MSRRCRRPRRSPRSRRSPATAMLPAVATLPATATLPAVAALRATAVRSVVSAVRTTWERVAIATLIASVPACPRRIPKRAFSHGSPTSSASRGAVPLTARGDADLARPVCGRHRRSVATFAYAPQAQRDALGAGGSAERRGQTASIGIVRKTSLEAMVGDPGDHRPNTTWRLSVDPGTGSRTAELSFLEERCAVGDRIPLHRHDVDEVVVVIDGVGAYTLEGEVNTVESGDVIFIPAGTAYGTVNIGDQVLHVHAAFPARKLLMEMLDRNPAPGNREPTANDDPVRLRHGRVRGSRSDYPLTDGGGYLIGRRAYIAGRSEHVGWTLTRPACAPYQRPQFRRSGTARKSLRLTRP